MNFWIYFFILFLIGSLPTAYVAGRFFKNVDIRRVGSGNVGATNAFRVLGKGPGIAVFTIDFLKGFLPVFFLSGNVWLGAAPVLGHIFTPFMGFKGGKGVATGAGVLAAVSPPVFVLSFLAWLAVFLATKIVSISSLFSLVSLVIWTLVFQVELELLLFIIVMVLLIIWTHRENIGRLVRGEEKPIVKR